MRAFVLITLFCTLLQHVASDVYLHNPRGSNNRLNALRKNTINPNRVFDSQNNDRGGYNVGVSEKYEGWHKKKTQYHMTYFMSGHPKRGAGKSILYIEWTNQHGCGGLGQNCDIILQYMCQPNTAKYQLDMKRNGKNEQTPKYRYNRWSNNNYREKTMQKVRQVRNNLVLNEPWEWYDKCYKRDRNKGLFVADQKLKGESSRFTRQNPNGKRRGYECPEERDYYPYWHPTDWVDIAVFTTRDCEKIKLESFNVKPKGECLEKYHRSNQLKHASKYNNPSDCKKHKGEWVEYSNFLEILPDFKTRQACLSSKTAKEIPVIWAIPYRSEYIDQPSKGKTPACLVKLLPPSCHDAPFSRPNHLGNAANSVPLAYNWSLPYFPSENEQRCIFRIRYNISTSDPQKKIKTNPTIYLLGKLPLQLAINTTQFGRTFQDRSHLFYLKSRKGTKLSDSHNVYNLNVRGKRGNIVQTFPAVEYDFVPKRMEVDQDDLIHVQWTGSNTNIYNNDGEGTKRTDRNNIVQMREPALSVPMDASDTNNMFGNAKIYWPDSKIENFELKMATAGYSNPRGQALQEQLNNASPSFLGAVMKFKKGHYSYMCTRNNNFSKRSQKGRLSICSLKNKA